MTLAEASRLMGARRSAERRAALPIGGAPLGAPLPTTFNSTAAWPKCASVIGHIRDQSDCGCALPPRARRGPLPPRR